MNVKLPKLKRALRKQIFEEISVLNGYASVAAHYTLELARDLNRMLRGLTDVSNDRAQLIRHNKNLIDLYLDALAALACGQMTDDRISTAIQALECMRTRKQGYISEARADVKRLKKKLDKALANRAAGRDHDSIRNLRHWLREDLRILKEDTQRASLIRQLLKELRKL